MNPENINNQKIQKAAYKSRVDLREKLEDKVAVLNPIDHTNRYRQLINQLLRLDKKIDSYEKQFGEPTVQERRMFQDVDQITHRRSNGLNKESSDEDK